MLSQEFIILETKIETFYFKIDLTFKFIVELTFT